MLRRPLYIGMLAAAVNRVALSPTMYGVDHRLVFVGYDFWQATDRVCGCAQ